MDYKITMIEILKYIEKNIKRQITAEEIAKKSGYSLYYFSRMFKSQMGLSIMEYVKERRFIKASEDVVDGKKIIDVALEYGYQSHSGFTKAFKNKFGFSPALLRAITFQINYLGGNCNMSHIFMKNTDIHATKEELYNILKASINENGLNYDEKNVEKAYRFACIAHNGQKRYSGDEYVTHSINVAILLSQMEASEDVVIAGLLHDIIFEKTSISIEEIENEFSQRVAKIIEAVTNYNENEVLTDETVIMIRIADRLHNMRTLEFTNEKYWEERAKETLDIFAPIAAKINNEKVIAELNELSLKYIK